MADLIEIAMRAAFCAEKSMEGCLPDQFELPSLFAEWIPDSTIAIDRKRWAEAVLGLRRASCWSCCGSSEPSGFGNVSNVIRVILIGFAFPFGAAAAG